MQHKPSCQVVTAPVDPAGMELYVKTQLQGTSATVSMVKHAINWFSHIANMTHNLVVTISCLTCLTSEHWSLNISSFQIHQNRLYALSLQYLLIMPELQNFVEVLFLFCGLSV